MTDKTKLISSLKSLCSFAEKRQTSQGLILYQTLIEKLEKADDKNETQEILEHLKISLAGIEAHGYFTNEEFEEVKKIRDMA